MKNALSRQLINERFYLKVASFVPRDFQTARDFGIATQDMNGLKAARCRHAASLCRLHSRANALRTRAGEGPNGSNRWCGPEVFEWRGYREIGGDQYYKVIFVPEQFTAKAMEPLFPA